MAGGSARAESRFGVAVEDYLRNQAAKIMANVRSETRSPRRPRRSLTKHSRAPTGLRKLKTLARQHLLFAMAWGAKIELDRFDSTKDLVTIDIPEPVMARIDHFLSDTMVQPYWGEITETTRSRVIAKLSDGIQNGDNLNDIIKQVGVAINDQGRAFGIARTEVTGALNAGHFAARQELMQSGHILTSEWIATMDGAVRIDHAALNGTEVAAGKDFLVGGFASPYPGHYSLPASERCNCRCIAVAGKTFADKPSPGAPAALPAPNHPAPVPRRLEPGISHGRSQRREVVRQGCHGRIPGRDSSAMQTIARSGCFGSRADHECVWAVYSGCLEAYVVWRQAASGIGNIHAGANPVPRDLAGRQKEAGLYFPVPPGRTAACPDRHTQTQCLLGLRSQAVLGDYRHAGQIRSQSGTRHAAHEAATLVETSSEEEHHPHPADCRCAL